MAGRSDSSDDVGGPGATPRRVRTPGKHIVLFALAATFMLALSTTVLRSGVSLPHYDLPQFAAGDGAYEAPMEFLTDIAPDATGRIAYLKLSMRIVARDGATLAEVKKKTPAIRERIVFLLRELTPEDFEGTEGMARIKAELVTRAGLPLGTGAVEDVIISDMIIQ